MDGLTQEIALFGERQLSPVGLNPQLTLDFDGWLAYCGDIPKITKFTHFTIGDLVLRGEGFTKRERDKGMALLLRDYSEAILKRDRWVCERIPVDHRRVGEISFEHHAALAGLTGPKTWIHCTTHNDGAKLECPECDAAQIAEVDALLDLAVKKELTTDDLKNAIQDARNDASASNGTGKRKAVRGQRKERAESAEPEPEPFDPKALIEAGKTLLHHTSTSARCFRKGYMVTGKGKPNRKNIEAAMNRADEIESAMADWRIEARRALDSTRALAR